MALDLTTAVLGAVLLTCWSSGSLAAGQQDDDKLQIRPLLDARLRYEHVEPPSLDANALTLRLRAGAEGKIRHFSLLAEAEATAALTYEYNAFPFALPGEDQWRPGHSVIADPMNFELNRLQLMYKNGDNAVTLRRQRINLDDQRWVGSVGWRQNEQTFEPLGSKAGWDRWPPISPTPPSKGQFSVQTPDRARHSTAALCSQACLQESDRWRANCLPTCSITMRAFTSPTAVRPMALSAGGQSQVRQGASG